jgi:hypothetical protein
LNRVCCAGGFTLLSTKNNSGSPVKDAISHFNETHGSTSDLQNSHVDQ